MLSACNVDGFIMEACELVQRETSLDDPNLARGTIDTDRFKLWLENCLLPILGNYEQGQPRSLVVLDNASIHHDDEIVRMIEETGAHILYSAPYSPDLNPIEYMFGKYKKMLQRYSYEGLDHATAHIKAMLSIRPRDAGGYYRHCGVPGCSNFPRIKRKGDGWEEDQSEMIELAAASVAIAAATVVSVVAKRRRLC